MSDYITTALHAYLKIIHQVKCRLLSFLPSDTKMCDFCVCSISEAMLSIASHHLIYSVTVKFIDSMALKSSSTSDHQLSMVYDWSYEIQSSSTVGSPTATSNVNSRLCASL